MPAEVAIGIYNVEIKLLAAGAMITKTDTASRSSKSASSSSCRHSARQHGLLYGLATAMMALMTGWLASVAFRRD